MGSAIRRAYTVMGDAVNPGVEGGASGEGRQRLPDPAERALGEISGIRVVGREPAEKGINPFIV